MTLQALLAELESHVREEIAVQARVLVLLAEQEAALQRGSASEIVRTTAALEGELKRTARRASQRQEILARMGRHWSIEPKALTITSICERVRTSGASTSQLAALRTELRGLMAQVVRHCRRMGALARANGQVLHQAIESALRQTDPAASAEGGALVNAEA